MIKKIGFDEIREYSEIRIDVSAKGVDEYNFYNADNYMFLIILLIHIKQQKVGVLIQIILNHYLNMWNKKWSQIIWLHFYIYKNLIKKFD